MIKILDKLNGFKKIKELASNNIDFFFFISYDKSKIIVNQLNSLTKEIKLCFDCNKNSLKKRVDLKKYPIDFNTYKKAFDKVIEEIKCGNTYLLNLTFKTRVQSNLDINKLYDIANAPYKVLIKDRFLCFSPESFIEIKDNKISTYPMKGTIDANIPNAKEIILNDKKEMAEHIMVVDLLRNDLNIVAKNTRVEEFRFISKIKSTNKELLQVSSKISAILPNNWNKNLDEILDKLTPAGSITGTPKKKTIEIIDSVELNKRGFYTGIFGIYKQKSLQSAVAIRVITKEDKELFYYSGGGITIDSVAQKEYQEMIDKIYIPI